MAAVMAEVSLLVPRSFLPCCAKPLLSCEFVIPDVSRVLLTSIPSNWPLHAWLYLPMIPFSLVVSRTPLVIWTTSPLVPLLSLWFSTTPISAVVCGSSSRFSPFTSCPTLWPPSPALACTLFPVVRVLYGHLCELDDGARYYPDINTIYYLYHDVPRSVPDCRIQIFCAHLECLASLICSLSLVCSNW
jgi:hypothetical protein